MKITVIVPVYNCEKLIRRCVDSILAQTHKDLEIILVDDGSKDRSGEVCDACAQKDPRIRVVHQANGGVSSARNAGLDLASGDFVTFVDGDDTVNSDMYRWLLQLMLEQNADITHCGYKHIVGEEVRLIHDTKKMWVQNREQALQSLITGDLFIGSMCNKLYKAALVRDIRLRDDIRNNEDILFNFEAFSKARKSVFSDYAYYNYIARIGTSACFTTADEKKLADRCAVDAYMYQHAQSPAVADAAAQRYLRSLSHYYLYCAKSAPGECRAVADRIWSVAKQTKNPGKRMLVTTRLIHYCPILYRVLYAAYDKVRKPNWEV